MFVFEVWDVLGICCYGFYGFVFVFVFCIVVSYDVGILKGCVVFVYLGGGCSVCVVEGGCSCDIIMVFILLGGILSFICFGDFDFGVLLYLLRYECLDV